MPSALHQQEIQLAARRAFEKCADERYDVMTLMPADEHCPARKRESPSLIRDDIHVEERLVTIRS